MSTPVVQAAESEQADHAESAPCPPPSDVGDERAARQARDANYQHLLERLFDRVSEVSSLPFAALRLVDLASDEQTSVDQLYDEIKTNPAMAARIASR